MNSLSWEEALQAMHNGKRVVHKYFTSEEYFEIQYGVIVCENGYNMSDWFKNEKWQLTGWRVL